MNSITSIEATFEGWNFYQITFYGTLKNSDHLFYLRTLGVGTVELLRVWDEVLRVECGNSRSQNVFLIYLVSDEGKA